MKPAGERDDQILTVEEAATLLRCGVKAVRRLVRLKRIKAQAINQKGSVRIHRSAIDGFLLGETPRKTETVL